MIVLKRKSYTLLIGLSLFFILIFCVAFAEILSPYDPILQNSSNRLSGPDFYHLLGTDQYGRDILSRVLYGGRTTLTAAFSALGLTLLIGISLGMASGFYGGVVDKVIMRVVDVVMAFPFMVLAIIITALFGSNFMNLLWTIVSVWWVPFARLSRGIVLNAKNDTNIIAAEILGAESWRIILKELFPLVISPAIILATFELGTLMLSISALSFFGLGSKPPSPEWGGMLADGKVYFFQAPHIILGPTLSIFLTVTALNLIGEGFRDILDPYEIPNLQKGHKRWLKNERK